MRSKGSKAGARAVAAGMLAASMLLAAGSMTAAQAQNKELSEKSVSVLMSYAWALTPPKFTTPTGKVIEVDKAKRNEVVVPIDTAREVIRVGRLSALAQLCGLAEEQGANYQTMMRREQMKKRWTDQQLLYISQLHLFTVMTMAGKVQVVEKDGEKEVVVQESKPAQAETCTETERQKVKEQITAYVNTAPPPVETTGAIATPAAAMAAEPAQTNKKKQ
jgi:hypothetical protein